MAHGALPHVFTSQATGEPYKLHDVENAFKRATKRARIKDLRFHDLRRSFASKLAQRGVSLQAIAKLLGHGATYVTERYVHFSVDDLRAAMKKLSTPPLLTEVGKNPATATPPSHRACIAARKRLKRRGIGGGGRIRTGE